MRALVIVMVQPFIQIGLQRADAVIELLAERDLVELLQDRLVEPLADAVGLGRLHLGFGVISVIGLPKNDRYCHGFGTHLKSVT